MKTGFFFAFLGLFVASICFSASPDDVVRDRALSFAKLVVTHTLDSEWREKILPEYWHPEGNDSGLFARKPDFLPPFDPTEGTFLITKLEAGRVLVGVSPWVLEGKQSVYCVELIFTVVAQVESKIILYKTPVIRSQYYCMALDKVDKKWKFIESYPYHASFYQIPYFLQASERIMGQGVVKNLPEVRQKLLDLAKK